MLRMIYYVISCRILAYGWQCTVSLRHDDSLHDLGRGPFNLHLRHAKSEVSDTSVQDEAFISNKSNLPVHPPIGTIHLQGYKPLQIDIHIRTRHNGAVPGQDLSLPYHQLGYRG
jgi:hypothetical protein